MSRSIFAAFLEHPLRRAFEHWFAELMFRHPLLSSDTQVLPGAHLRDLVAEVAAVAMPAEPPPVEPKVNTRAWSPERRARASARWARMTPEERQARLERMQAGRSKRRP